MKKILSISAIVLALFTIVSCKNSSKDNGSNSKEFMYTGKYMTICTDSLVRGYYQNLAIISVDDDEYNVEFGSSLVNGHQCCQFDSKGSITNDTLMVNIGDSSQVAYMTISPTPDQQGVNVFTQKFDDRYKLMYYCSGGASLAGTYYKNLILEDYVGNISKDENFNYLISLFPDNQKVKSIETSISQEEYPNAVSYNLSDVDGNLLYTVTSLNANDEKADINIITIKNPSFQTNEGINLFSSYSDVIKAYPNCIINEDSSSVSIPQLNCYITFNGSIKDTKADSLKIKNIQIKWNISKN